MKQQVMLILITMMFYIGICSAQTSALEQSIALTDGMLSPMINPASLGYGNSYGLGWMQLWKNEAFRNHYWLFVNTEGISYVYEKQLHGTNTHTLATGFELTGPYIIPNLYVGSSYKWINNKTNEGDYRSGLLYRPVKFASIAFTLDNPDKDVPSYQAGFAWRPLSQFNKMDEHRLEISADFDYSKNDLGDYELKQPIIGLQTEIFDGVKFGGTYNLENENIGFNFSLSAKKTQMGIINPNSDDVDQGYGYIFLPKKSFLPFLNLHRKQWFSLPVGKEVITYKTPQYKIGPFSIFDNKQTDVETILNNIEKSKNDPAISGLVFINKNFSSSLALKQEMINAIRSFKETGKQVVFYYDNMSNGDYLFASAVADKIYLNPQGGIDLKGISINSPYLKDALEKLGIEVINFRSHPYKTAGNMLSESSMPEEERREYERILTSLYSQMCAMIVSGRGEKLTKPITDIIDNGPYYIAGDALEAGLVDELVYESHFRENLSSDFNFGKVVNNLDDYLSYTWTHPKKSKIAIIYAQGNIVMGRSEAGKNVAHETTTELIRKARKNKDYKGIIIRVDSGGGSAQASDIIHEEIELARTEDKKPVVISMAGVAGSGGYYIACNADYIYASPATITGSIGVIGLTFSAQNMFKKLYINWSTVKKGKRSDFGSFTRQWTDDEKLLMERLISTSYQDFVNKVSVGRNKNYAEIDSIAQGKIWTGDEAILNGLIDELGGLKEATEKIKILANIKGDLELVNLRKNESGFNLSFGVDTKVPFFNQNASFELINKYIEIYNKWQNLESERVLFLSPYDLDSLAEF